MKKIIDLWSQIPEFPRDIIKAVASCLIVMWIVIGIGSFIFSFAPDDGAWWEFPMILTLTIIGIGGLAAPLIWLSDKYDP